MKKENNYGDLLTPYILNYFNIPYQYTLPNIADIICVGSIVSYAADDTLVLGSGLIQEKQKINPNAIYKFVRGPLTRKKIIESGGFCPEIYGDPALLLPFIWKESKKEFDVGLVPHIINYKEAKENYPDYNIIDLKGDPEKVTKEISKCEKIISSSLHGIVVAHAYGIPAAWVKFSQKLSGDDIKFYDYYESVNLKAVLSTVENPIYSTGKYDLKTIKEIFNEMSS